MVDMTKKNRGRARFVRGDRLAPGVNSLHVYGPDGAHLLEILHMRDGRVLLSLSFPHWHQFRFGFSLRRARLFASEVLRSLRSQEAYETRTRAFFQVMADALVDARERSARPLPWEGPDCAPVLPIAFADAAREVFIVDDPDDEEDERPGCVTVRRTVACAEHARRVYRISEAALRSAQRTRAIPCPVCVAAIVAELHGSVRALAAKVRR